VSSVTWLPFGPAREITYPHRTQTRRYDLNYAIDAIYATGGLTLDFAVDVLGNPTAVATSLGGPPARTYTYDALNRLRAALHAGQPVEQFTHDLTVNRLKKSGSPRSPVVSYDYEPTSHRLIAVDGFARQYDAAGNQINGFLPGVQSFIAYGDHNRPIGWTIPRQGQGLCRHNARGERVYMRTPDDTAREIEQFVTHAETGQRLETRRGAATQTLVWLEDLPVGVIDGGVVHAIESDHLGTPRLAARLDTGATTWTWDFTGSSFGDHAPRETGLVLDLRYPGQHYDRHTGWHYNYFRDYEPGTGRYVQSDPIGLGGGVSTYGYALQNPWRFVDPTGEQAQLALCFGGPVPCALAAGSMVACGIAVLQSRRFPQLDGVPEPPDPSTWQCENPVCESPKPSPPERDECVLMYAKLVAKCRGLALARWTACQGAATAAFMACVTIRAFSL
jgi:RHS repeat-associated protein